MIAIVDYGAGNIFSVKNALDFLGLESQLTNDAAAIQAADAIILPGVGAFPSAMQMLKERNLVSVLQTESKKKPFLGICLGMQLIFENGSIDSGNGRKNSSKRLDYSAHGLEQAGISD